MTIEKRPFSMVMSFFIKLIPFYLIYNYIKMNLIRNYILLLDKNLNSLFLSYVIIN